MVLQHVHCQTKSRFMGNHTLCIIYKKVLCYCTKFQENKNPDKEDTSLKKKKENL